MSNEGKRRKSEVEKYEIKRELERKMEIENERLQMAKRSEKIVQNINKSE